MSEEQPVQTGIVSAVMGAINGPREPGPHGRARTQGAGEALGTLIPDERAADVIALDPEKYDEQGNPRVQGIVAGSIAPIKAKDLRNLTASAVGEAVQEAVPAPSPQRNAVRHPPQFKVPPTCGADGDITDLAPMRTTKATDEHAYKVADEIVSAERELPPGIDGVSELMTLARAYKIAAHRRIGRMPPAGNAEQIARVLIGGMKGLPLTPFAIDSMALAFAYVSRCNCERAGSF